jgi:hypothetical protein
MILFVIIYWYKKCGFHIKPTHAILRERFGHNGSAHNGSARDVPWRDAVHCKP